MTQNNYEREYVAAEETTVPSLGEVALTGIVSIGSFGLAAYSFKEGNSELTTFFGSMGVVSSVYTAWLQSKRQR